MLLELGIAVVLMILGHSLFRRFEERTTRWRIALKWINYLAITVLLSLTAGRAWALAWVVGLPALGLTFHTWWTRRNGITFLTAEPREKYYRLRGWSEYPR